MNKIIVSIMVLIWTIACRVDRPEPEPLVKDIRDSIFNTFTDIYYWSDQLPDANSFKIHSYNSPVDIINSLRKFSPANPIDKLPIDRWSFVIKNDIWQQTLSGISTDYGLGLRFAAENDLRISWVQPESAAGKANLKRGQRVINLNDISANVKNSNEIIALLLSSSDLAFTIKNNNDQEQIVLLKKQAYKFDPIPYTTLMKSNSGNILYVNIQSFSESTVDRFETILDNYKNTSFDEIAIDLRYNGGGLVSEMEELANILVGNLANHKIMYSINHNERYKAFDSNIKFEATKQSLSLKKIYFITTESTASASEMLINSLKPYINVITIGSRTQGKLMGMYVIPVQNYVVAPLSYRVQNANGEPSQFVGIEPTVIKSDDLLHDFNSDESCINTIFTVVNKGKLIRSYENISNKTDLNKTYHFEGAFRIFKPSR